MDEEKFKKKDCFDTVKKDFESVIIKFKDYYACDEQNFAAE